jgi:hypothetical protein
MVSAAESGRLNLDGRRILLVGGLRQRVTHFKKLVEACDGRFAHHDGGMEESMERLDSLFGRADAVLFPIDYVSHAALDRVKRLCRRWNKPYLPMKRCGIAAFTEALEAYANGTGAKVGTVGPAARPAAGSAAS